METRFNPAAVGVFVLGLGALLVAAVLWLASGGKLGHRVDVYQSLSDESVAGLSVNAPVKYRGVNVGKVTGIQLDPQNTEKVRLTYELEGGTPVKTDTLATLTSQGLTGIAFVELSGGSRNAPRLLPRVPGQPPLIPTKPSLSARLESVLSRVLASMDRASDNLSGFFSNENKAALRSTLADVAALAHTLAERRQTIDAAVADAGRTLHGSAQASAQLAPMIERIGRGADAVRAAASQAEATGARAGHAVDALGADAQRLTDQTVPQLEELMNEMTLLSASLRRLSETTQRDPASLLRGPAPQPKGPGE